MYMNPHNQLHAADTSPMRQLVDLLRNAGTELTLMPGEPILRCGQRCDFFFVVLSGSFRAYRWIGDKEMIIGFSFAGDIDTAPYAYITDSHSTETIEAITKSTVAKVHRSQLHEIIARNPTMQGITEIMLAQYIEVLVNRHIEFKTFTAEQLYHALFRRQPEEVRQIPLKYIASYLGISQERLSRIRAKSTG